MEHIARVHFTRGSGQIVWIPNYLPTSPGETQNSKVLQTLEHLARGQIDGGISLGGRKIEHLARRQIGGGISPVGRKIGALCQGPGGR